MSDIVKIKITGLNEKEPEATDFSVIADTDGFAYKTKNASINDRNKTLSTLGFLRTPSTFDFSTQLVPELEPTKYANYIFEIGYNYDLGGQTITLPENIVLDFKGGKFSNGSIIGNKSKISAKLEQIFDSNITIGGTFNVTAVYPEWFGAVGDDVNDDAIAFSKSIIQDGIKVVQTKDLYFKTKVLITKNNIQIEAVSSGYTDPILFSQVASDYAIEVESFGVNFDRINLQGNGELFGVDATTKGIWFKSFDGDNIDCEINKCGITRMSECLKITGRNVKIQHNIFAQSLVGINVNAPADGDGRGIIIENNRFHSMGTTSVSSTCISTTNTCHSMKIDNNYFDSVYKCFDGVLTRSSFNNNQMIIVYNNAVTINKSANTIGLLAMGDCSGNIIYASAPSFSGNGIVLNDCDDIKVTENTIVGVRYNGISLITTANNLILNNLIVSPNFNVSTDGAIYGAISIDASSINNLISGNKTRTSLSGMRSFCIVGNVNNVFGINDVASGIDVYSNQTNNRDFSLLDIKRTTTTLNTNNINVNSLANQTIQSLINNSIVSTDEVGLSFKTKRVDLSIIELAKAVAKIVSSGVGIEKGKYVFSTMNNGTMTEKAEIGWDSGLNVYSSLWSDKPLILGVYHLWVDSLGILRIKSSAPTSDTDGTVVGTQS